MPPLPRQSFQAEVKNATDHRLHFQHVESFTAAQINAGANLLLPINNRRYRVIDANMVAVGGAVAGATSVDINATQGAVAVKPLSVAIAGLTQNALVRAGATNAAILAGGASYGLCDYATGLTVGKTGGTMTGATSILVMISYTIER
jgi:hypothetical protein